MKSKTFKIPASLHGVVCAVVLAIWTMFALAVGYLLLTKQPVPPELWQLAGGSLLSYLGLKATPDEG